MHVRPSRISLFQILMRAFEKHKPDIKQAFQEKRLS